jgi:hypothetical membrane protein
VAHAPSSIETFAERRPRLGPFLYVSSLQYFIVQFLVALDWSPPYNLRRNAISDLGNTACGRFDGRYVCSPLHTVMNVSFVVLGVTMVVASVLIHTAVVSTRTSSLGFIFMAIGGLGVVVVGLFPENSVPVLHGAGASLPFLVGNVGVLLLGLALEMPFALRLITLLVGAVSLVALALYASAHYLGVGVGGMERIVAYPQTFWLILFGTYLLRRSPVRGWRSVLRR